MTDAVGKEIVIEGVDPRELYGPKNAYLDQIRTLFPTLKIVARGSSIKVLGPEAETRLFARRLDGLVAYYIKYGYISSQVVDQCFAGGTALAEAPVDKDVIVYGNNGNIIRARTVNQQRLVQLYEHDDLLFAVGPAGSGKTYTAIALAVRALKERQVRRIILTRPAVEAGEKLGFLPGDMKEKLDPYLQPLYDALNDMIPPARLVKYMEEGTVQIAPLAYMRGRTLDNAFVILDEAQNTTLSQIKMFLTRMGATRASSSRATSRRSTCRASRTAVWCAPWSCCAGSTASASSSSTAATSCAIRSSNRLSRPSSTLPTGPRHPNTKHRTIKKNSHGQKLNGAQTGACLETFCRNRAHPAPLAP